MHDEIRLQPARPVTDNTPLAVEVDLHVTTAGNAEDAQQTLTGADDRSYNVDTYIVASTTPPGVPRRR